MTLFRKLLLLALLQLSYNQSSAQGRLVSVVRQQTLTLTQQVDSVIAEFGLNIRKQDLSRAVSLLKYVGRDVHCVALSYRTQDPSGREVLASGLFSYPEKGPFRGAVEMLPYSRQKSMCGSVRLYSPEAMVSVLGYVVLVPDTIGYGASGDLDIAYHLCENTALVAAHFREAVQEYLSTVLGRKLPRKTTLFGYSLGASGALALAYYYAEHPQCDVKVQALCLGGGAYNPSIALDYSINRGEMNYLLYPAFVRSLNTWNHAGLNPSRLFCGLVLRDWERVSDGSLNALQMVKTYGADLHAYLHPDFFSGEGNSDIRRLKECLSDIAVPSPGKCPLPRGTKIVVRHSVADDIVPVACSDTLVNRLRRFGLLYFRSPSGTHHETAVRSFLDLALLLL